MAAAIVPGLGVGARVLVKDMEGTVRFCGNTEFAAGKWIGIELDTSDGKNSGSVQGKEYFQCRPNHGLFVRQSQLTVIEPAPEGAIMASPSRSPLRSPAVTPQISRTPALGSAARSPAGALTPAPTTPISGRSSSPQPSVPSPGTPLATPGPSAADVSEDTRTLQLALDELTTKYKALETLRQEDLIKLKELDRLRVAVDQHAQYKVQWFQQRKEKDETLRGKEHLIKELEEKYNSVDDQINEALEAAEMATLDKEMAEEQLDLMKQENEQLKEQVETLKLDLEIIQTDSESQDGVANSIQVKQLETQLERHKDALVKLRDLAAVEKQELTNRVKELEKELSTLRDVQAKNTQLRDEIHAAEAQIDELKERIDDAKAAEDMVESLIEKNLNLEDRIRELEENVVDLEALRDMSDEVEEQHAELTRQLTTELDFSKAEISEKSRQLRLAEEEFAEYEQTIQKFRALVSSMQEEARYRSRNSESDSSAAALIATPQISVEMSVLSAKAQSRAIEGELRKLDYQQAQIHTAILQAYMPESFNKTDRACILVVLLLDRLGYKSDMILAHVRQQYDIDSAPSSTRIAPDMRAFACRVLLCIQAFRNQVRETQWRLVNSDECALLKLASIYGELSVCEGRLDGLIHLIKSEELTFNVPLEDIAKATALFVHVCDSHLPNAQSAPLERVRRALGTTLVLVEAAEADVCQAIGFISDGDELIRPVAVNARRMVESVRKELRRLPSEHETLDLSNGSCIPSSSLGEIALAIHADLSGFEPVANAVRQWTALVLKQASAQDNSIPEPVKRDTAEDLFEMAWAALPPSEGTGTVAEQVGHTFKHVSQRICEQLDGALSHENVLKTEAITHHPAFVRAKIVRDEFADAAGLREIVDIKEEELLDLATQIKIKDKETEEDHTRITMLKNKIDSLLADTTKMAELERRIARSQDSESKLKEALEALEDDLDRMHRENANLKRLARGKKGGPESMSPSKLGTPNTTMGDYSGVSTPADSPRMGRAVGGQDASRSNLAVLQQAIRVLRHENARLASESCRLAVAELGPLPANDQSSLVELNNLKTECRSLVKVLQDTRATARVVPLGTKGRAVLCAQRERLRQLNEKNEKLKEKGIQLLAKVVPEARASTDFSAFLRPGYAKSISSTSDNIPLGRLTLPCTAAPDLPPSRSVTLDANQFSSIHAVFAM